MCTCVECNELFVLNFIFVVSKFIINLLAPTPFNHERELNLTLNRKFMLEIVVIVSSANNKQIIFIEI
jgi:hypothetical protein